MGSQFLLEGIFLTQRLNLGFLYCRRILYHLRRREALMAPNIQIGKLRSSETRG